MPQLQSFTFRGAQRTYFYAYPSSWTMPSLVSIDVTASLFGLKLLSAIQAPLLKTVRLDGMKTQPSRRYPDPRIRRFLQLDDLVHLSSNSPVISQLDLVSIIMSFPISTYPPLLGGYTLPCLEVLRLQSSDITDDVIQRCKPGTNLRRLELFQCRDVSPVGILRFAEVCPENFEIIVESSEC
jgi:hypothetical protein